MGSRTTRNFVTTSLAAALIGGCFDAASASEFSVVYSFAASTGANRPGALTYVNGTLYGASHSSGSGGYFGAIFSITPTGAENVLYYFSGSTDGAYPTGPLTYLDGVLYGTTSGGLKKSPTRYGTMFSISLQGDLKTLYTFKRHGAAGTGPNQLVDSGDALYGTTFGGASTLGGAFFSKTQAGRLKVLHTFGGLGDVAQCQGSLLNAGGIFYGSAGISFASGTANPNGAVYSITPTGVEKTIYTFQGGDDGSGPENLIESNGLLYGTTGSGGGGLCESGCGTVFSLSPTGSETVLHTFSSKSDGYFPEGGLTSVNGTFYGVTLGGGTHNKGTIYSVEPNGTEKVVHSFNGSTDGASPVATLVNVNGILYGTTQDDGASGGGTVFSFTP